MAGEQLSMFDVPGFLPVPERRELCREWVGGVKNDCGVYTVNTYTFSAANEHGERLELRMALAYPYVLGNIDTMLGAPTYYGCGRPLTDNAPIRLSVFDDEWQAECALAESVNAILVNDSNINGFELDRMLDLAKDVVRQAMESMTC